MSSVYAPRGRVHPDKASPPPPAPRLADSLIVPGLIADEKDKNTNLGVNRPLTRKCKAAAPCIVTGRRGRTRANAFILDELRVRSCRS
ncbi:hypothetical protein EVAR_48240_1 [Eumeta japonica]|uniref:Uncharacterized protein n=1 Tax=Eumeta variegata TaxID=151549 RepID=A0A4C1YGL4_EUMVA|nr:hypothetical protein EVAR_48240_1 [Eumeta japonica]